MHGFFLNLNSTVVDKFLLLWTTFYRCGSSTGVDMPEIPPYDMLRTHVREWLISKRWGTINNPFDGAIPRWHRFLQPYYQLRYGDSKKTPSVKQLYAIFYGVRGMPEDLYGLMLEEFNFKCPWWALRPIDKTGAERKVFQSITANGVRDSYFDFAKPRREAKR